MSFFKQLRNNKMYAALFALFILFVIFMILVATGVVKFGNDDDDISVVKQAKLTVSV